MSVDNKRILAIVSASVIEVVNPWGKWGGGGGGGGIPYERDGDDPPLALGRKLRILVSVFLTVFFFSDKTRIFCR